MLPTSYTNSQPMISATLPQYFHFPHHNDHSEHSTRLSRQSLFPQIISCSLGWILWTACLQPARHFYNSLLPSVGCLLPQVQAMSNILAIYHAIQSLPTAYTKTFSIVIKLPTTIHYVSESNCFLLQVKPLKSLYVTVLRLHSSCQ